MGVCHRDFWMGPAWGVAGLVTGGGGGLFVAAVLLALRGRAILGWEPAQAGLILTGGGPLAVLPWLIALAAAGRGVAMTRPLAWFAPLWLLGAVVAVGIAAAHAVAPR